MLGAPYEGVPVARTGAARWRRIVMPLLVLSAVGLVAVLLAGRGQQTAIQGAGSTLAQPLIERSATAFRDAQAADDPTRPEKTGDDWVLSGSGIDYEPVGSLGGIMRLSDPEVDFAVSDYPLSSEGLEDFGVAQSPVALGAIAVVHSIDLPEGRHLRLDTPTLAAIYLGEITRWNDPRIVALNPGVTLPESSVSVVHRSDGSGSTKGFTGYPSAGSPQWSAGPGVGTEIEWPTGTGAERTEGVIDTCAPTRDRSVTSNTARPSAPISTPSHRQRLRGVRPADEARCSRRLRPRMERKRRLRHRAGASDDEQAYPATVAIYVMVKRDPDFAQQTQRTLRYLRFLLQDFGAPAKELGYVPMPASAAKAIESYWTNGFRRDLTGPHPLPIPTEPPRRTSWKSTSSRRSSSP